MKTIKLLTVLLMVCFSVKGQVTMNSGAKGGNEGTHVLIDGTQFATEITGDDLIGKGIIVPSVDLTQFEFTDVSNGLASGVFLTFYDGMIVYNRVAGLTNNTGYNPSKQTKVVPGFYYFHNPDAFSLYDLGEIDELGAIRGGEWRPLGSGPIAEGTVKYEDGGLKYWDGEEWQDLEWQGNGGGDGGTNPDGSGNLTVGSNTYKTYTYDGVTWMVTNSKEGPSSAQSYSNDGTRINGNYYTWSQAAGACPTGWHLPDQAEWTLLKDWVNSNMSHEGAKFWVTDSGSAFAGSYYGGGWFHWGTYGYWWSVGASGQYFFAGTDGTGGPNTLEAASWSSVRCVKDVVIGVTGITVTGPASVTAGTPTQMNATVTPTDAANKTLNWSVQNGTGTATITTAGVLTGSTTGTVTVTATATDGSNVSSAAYTVTVTAATNPDGSTDMQIGNNTYETYTYTYPNSSTATWMVTNSREGTSSATYYGTNTNNANGFYYIWGQAATACPTGWHLPTQAEWNLQRDWVNSNMSHEGAKFWVTTDGNAFAGFHNIYGTWDYWDRGGFWWGATSGLCGTAYTSSMGVGTRSASDWVSVRCVKDAVVGVTGITVTGPASVTAGTATQMNATVTPTDAANKTLSWTVQNGTGTATITTAGVLTGGTTGTVTVTATTTDGSSVSSAAYTVTVTAEIGSVVGRSTQCNVSEPSACTCSVGTPMSYSELTPGQLVDARSFFGNPILLFGNKTPNAYNWWAWSVANWMNHGTGSAGYMACIQQ